MYGTTVHGGMNNYGTVFSVTTTGAENVLYQFHYGHDGAWPYAGLTAVNGILYGTTITGGSGCGSYYNCGTIFSVTTTGEEKVLHSFNGFDGANPYSVLLDVRGTLYGTTLGGGTSANGTLFSVTTDGAEKVLYSFLGGSDGIFPQGTLVDVKRVLYGTTSAGGPSNNGTVFSATTTGAEKVLYSFAGGSDGSEPLAGLIDVKGTLYGTTGYDGRRGCDKAGCGTVFAFTP
jgi:uncharacterized repeat protein (TIGR03803 family)